MLAFKFTLCMCSWLAGALSCPCCMPSSAILRHHARPHNDVFSAVGQRSLVCLASTCSYKHFMLRLVVCLLSSSPVEHWIGAEVPGMLFFWRSRRNFNWVCETCTSRIKITLPTTQGCSSCFTYSSRWRWSVTSCLSHLPFEFCADCIEQNDILQVHTTLHTSTLSHVAGCKLCVLCYDWCLLFLYVCRCACLVSVLFQPTNKIGCDPLN